MCDTSRREQRHFELFPFLFGSDWLKYKHSERSARHGRHEQRGFFMRHGHHDSDRFEGRSPFGVRRPLRFLAHKLDLDEKQITALMRILDEVKTERRKPRWTSAVQPRNLPTRWRAMRLMARRPRALAIGGSRVRRGCARPSRVGFRKSTRF